MEQKFSAWFHRLLEWLASTPRVGALHLQGTVVTYLRLDGAVEAASVPLDPGVLRDGRIVDRDRFRAALAELRAKIPQSGKRGVRVVVVIPAEPVYTQSFTIPNVGRDRLEESAVLNLQMVSPVAQGGAYMHYELLEETSEHYELLGAFVEKGVVDEFRAVLEETGFAPVIFEFPSLSLTRLMAQVLGPREFTTLVFSLSSDGIEFSIVKRGKLHFSYFRSWISVQGSAREISREVFEDTVVREVQKVVNFSLGKFKERPREVVLVAQGLEEEMRALIEERFGLPVTTLMVGGGLTPPWYTVLGAALRGKGDLSIDESINLAPLSSRELFFEEQAIGFVKLWRNVTVGVLGLFTIFFAGSAYFLHRTEALVGAQLADFSGRFNQTELEELTKRVEEFNALVGAVGEVAGARTPWHVMLRNIERVMAAHEVTLNRVTVEPTGKRTILEARAPSSDRILAFKSALAEAPGITEVNLLVSQIAALEDNTVGFTVTFTPVFSRE